MKTRTGRYLRVLLVAVVIISTLTVSVTSFAALSEAQVEALRKISNGEPTEWELLSPDQQDELRIKAEASMANYQKYHLPHGYNADILWSDFDRTEALRYEGLGDSLCWTGHYLCSLAFKYAVTKDPQTLEDINYILDGIDKLTRVSGREGYIARYSGPADDPAYQPYYEAAGESCPAYYAEGEFEGEVWLGNSSRDAYIGANIGLSAVWKFVEDYATREKLRVIVERVVDRMDADDWWIVDGKGHVTLPINWFGLTWMKIGINVNPEKYTEIRKKYDALYEVAMKMPNGSDWSKANSKYAEWYFGYNLDIDLMLSLVLLEDDSVKLDNYKKVLGDMYEKVSDHLNGYFAAIYLFGTGKMDDTAAVATLQGCIYDMPPAPVYDAKIDHSNDPETVEKINIRFAKNAYLPSERPRADFIWQKNPVLRHGGTDGPMEWPGMDTFLPYWMGRYMGLFK